MKKAPKTGNATIVVVDHGRVVERSVTDKPRKAFNQTCHSWAVEPTYPAAWDGKCFTVLCQIHD